MEVLFPESYSPDSSSPAAAPPQPPAQSQQQKAPEAQRPSRDELIKKLREKTGRNRNRRPEQPFAPLLSAKTGLAESIIQDLIAKTGKKKISKHPLKFAKQLAALLPQPTNSNSI